MKLLALIGLLSVVPAVIYYLYCRGQSSDRGRSGMQPTDIPTHWNHHRLRRGGGDVYCPTSYWDRLDEVRRIQEHREHMSELRRQTDVMQRTTGGPVPGGPIDRLWKGEW